MTDQPVDIDPQHLPVEYTNVVVGDDPNVQVADDQTPEPHIEQEAGR